MVEHAHELAPELLSRDAVDVEVDGMVDVHEEVADDADQDVFGVFMIVGVPVLDEGEDGDGRRGEDPDEGDTEKHDGQLVVVGHGGLAVVLLDGAVRDRVPMLHQAHDDHHVTDEHHAEGNGGIDGEVDPREHVLREVAIIHGALTFPAIFPHLDEMIGPEIMQVDGD